MATQDPTLARDLTEVFLKSTLSSQPRVLKAICAIVESATTTDQLKAAAIETILSGLESRVFANGDFYLSFGAAKTDNTRALHLKLLAGAAWEGSQTQNLFRDIVSRGAKNQVGSDNEIAGYLFDGCPGFTDWLSLAIALQRPVADVNQSADGFTSLLESAFSSPGDHAKPRTASLVESLLNGIGTSPKSFASGLFVASGFLKCQGITRALSNEQVASAVNRCLKLLVDNLSGNDAITGNFRNLLLTAEPSVAIAAIQLAKKSNPIRLSFTLGGGALDRRPLSRLRGAEEDISPSKKIVQEACSFMLAHPGVAVSECYQFFMRNRELGLAERAKEFATRISQMIDTARSDKLMPLVEELKDQGLLDLSAAVARYFAKFGNNAEHLTWLVSRAEQITSDFNTVAAAIGEKSARFIASRDPTKVMAGRGAAKRLRKIRRSRASFKRVRRLGGIGALNRAVELNSRVGSFGRFFDFVVRNTLGIRR